MNNGKETNIDTLIEEHRVLKKEVERLKTQVNDLQAELRLTRRYLNATDAEILQSVMKI